MDSIAFKMRPQPGQHQLRKSWPCAYGRVRSLDLNPLPPRKWPDVPLPIGLYLSQNSLFETLGLSGTLANSTMSRSVTEIA